MDKYTQLSAVQLRATVGGKRTWKNFVSYMGSYYKGLWDGLVG
ncbi:MULTISPECIES: hypothetical protein [Enterococcus]|uniref:Uncharacterized protein n=2 Tax=Enterococcus TaxID=1350 RepID=R2SDV7_9ENTE|nr:MULTISPECIES: hypothetical protein [Enterococcus]EOH91041.1 hypothetical protein UAU_03580 [Enterococcus pallens ATCC BAA-351]EOU16238.1 hypothetical protein I588_03894 [Enterococcus pallens ATCC BAA-351]OJG79022.1 hypothetical protein RV10_GL001145 [Enterococcus pallens]